MKAPWTKEQVHKLNASQSSGWRHPFTCPGDANCERRELLATEAGWVCACGQYTQDWAHEEMLSAAESPFAGLSPPLTVMPKEAIDG